MKYATTDKLNDSMKAKVFKYRSDGNTVVAPYMELEPYAENVYLSLSSSTEKTAGTKLPPIAGTGSRIRFRARKEEPLSG